MLIDDREPPGSGEPRSPLEPNWRALFWAAAAGILIFAGVHASGFIAYLILCATVYAACRGAVALVDYGEGLREWRQ